MAGGPRAAGGRVPGMTDYGTNYVANNGSGTIGFGRYCLKHLSQWSKPDKRRVQFPLGLPGAKAELRYEPDGSLTLRRALWGAIR